MSEFTMSQAKKCNVGGENLHTVKGTGSHLHNDGDHKCMQIGLKTEASDLHVDTDKKMRAENEIGEVDKPSLDTNVSDNEACKTQDPDQPKDSLRQSDLDLSAKDREPARLDTNVADCGFKKEFKTPGSSSTVRVVNNKDGSQVPAGVMEEDCKNPPGSSSTVRVVNSDDAFRVPADGGLEEDCIKPDKDEKGGKAKDVLNVLLKEGLKVKFTKTRNNIQKNKKTYNSSAADNSESSGETTDNLETSDYIFNGPKKPALSDVSPRSSSGAGYLCDSESGDERVSDGSLDIFTTKPLNPSIKCEPVIACSEPSVVSPPPPPITTACSVTTSDVTVTTATKTTSCVTLVTTLTTTSVTVTTATPTVQTIVSNNYHNHQHQHHNQHNSLPHQSQSPVLVSTVPPVRTVPVVTTSTQTFYQSSQPVPASIDTYTFQPLPATVDSKKHSPHLNYHSPHLSYSNHKNKPVNLEKTAISSDKDSVSVDRVVDKKPRLSNSPVLKRPPPSPQISRFSRSPPRHKSHPPPPLTSTSRSSSPYIVSSAQSLSNASSASSSVISREPKRTPPLSRTPHREAVLERDPYPQVLPPSLGVSKSFFPPGFQGHGTHQSLYSPLGPSPGLHPSHSTPSHLAAYPGPGLSSLHPHHPGTPQPPQAHMFAPPLPLGPPAGPLPGAAPSAPTAHLQPESPLSIANPDLLREELNRRFLASQDRSPLLQGVPPFLRADIHQHMHQHQHQHQHTHQHTYTGLPPPPISASSIVAPPTSHMLEKISTNPFFRQGLPSGIAEPAPRIIPNGKDKPTIPQHPRSAIPGLHGYPSLLLNPTGAGISDPLSSGLPGAFQPKGLSSLHPGGAAPPVFMHGREIEKTPSHHSTPQPPVSAFPKKPGKWCAVHVRIAWEVYRQQQKLPSDKGSDGRSSDPLRPPSHLLPGSSMSSPDMFTSSAHSFRSSSRSGLPASPHNILNSASHIGPHSFPRPSPYSIGTSLPLGIGNGIVSSREPPSIPSASHEWNRLHRTPPTFPTPPSWTKPDEREKEMEREREMSMERRRNEEDRERERRLMEHDRHRFSSIEERSRERLRESDILAKARSRSRSRSPMRNGRIDSVVKSERSYDRRPEESSVLKIKEERRDSIAREEEMMSLRAADPFLHSSLMDRTRMLTPATFLGGDRPPAPPHPSLWNPFERSQTDFINQRLGLQRELEQARDPFFNRFPAPGLHHPGFPGISGISAMEQERIREEMIMRDTERVKRDYLERLPLMERERLYYENSKLPLRPPDHLAHAFMRNMSPALNNIKRSSPSVGPGGPPPLIHSGTSSQTRVRGSPVVNKSKGVSPTDSVGESKRDSNSNSTDPEAHSR